MHLRGIGAVEIEACGFDVQDNMVCAVQYGHFDPPTPFTPTLHIEPMPSPSLFWPDDNPICVTNVYRHTQFYEDFSLWLADHLQTEVDITADLVNIDENYAYYLSVDCYGDVVISNTAAEFTFPLVAGQE